MANSTVTLILTGVSAVLGLLVLTGSSILIADFRNWHSTCHDILSLLDEYKITTIPGVGDVSSVVTCKDFDWTMAAASIGIIAAVLQMIFCVLAFIKRGDGPVSKMWPIAHVVVFVLTVASFGIGVKFMGGDILKEIYKLDNISQIEIPDFGNWIPGVELPSISELLPHLPDSLLVKAKYQFFNAAVGLDWIYCLLATIVYFVMARK